MSTDEKRACIRLAAQLVRMGWPDDDPRHDYCLPRDQVVTIALKLRDLADGKPLEELRP